MHVIMTITMKREKKNGDRRNKIKAYYNILTPIHAIYENGSEIYVIF